MILCTGTTPTVQRTMTFARLDIGEVNRSADVVQTASGKSINVARVLTTIGQRCIATGFLGGDSGQFIRRELDRAGMAHDFVEVQPFTRTCTTIIDQAAGQVTELVEESKQVEIEAWEKLRNKIDTLLGQATLLVLSGSLTPAAPQDFYDWCVARAASNNIRTIVDSAAEPLRLALEQRPFLVKPNRVELAKTVGTNELKDGVRKLVQLGATWVVCTMGKEGSIVSDGTHFWKLISPGVRVISAIGSGDAYAAGIAAGLVQGEDLPDAARLGVACATANAMLPIAGYLRPEDVHMLLPQIRLEPF